ncbi:Contactin-3 [Labeo rohita]|uniref:Contactin-3 n=1 Tax=Labeo rohita TaxID=84645 RepID=A0ABQ8L821_LABRO|nr:Contactin-3 [Labeo rohita]
MADKCHLCLLGLIILSSLLTGTSGVNDSHVFISSGENVCLPCNNHLHDCTSTVWKYYTHSAAVELIGGGIKKNTERHERLSLGSDCSLHIKYITKKDYGLYSCQQWTVTGQRLIHDAHVFLHVLHVSSSSSQTEISAGSSVTLYCQLYSYSYAGDSCDNWIHSEGIQLFWVNQTGVNMTISDSRYQESAPGHCIITLTTTLLNEDDNREWRCEVTHRNQVMMRDRGNRQSESGRWVQPRMARARGMRRQHSWRLDVSNGPPTGTQDIAAPHTCSHRHCTGLAALQIREQTRSSACRTRQD